MAQDRIDEVINRVYRLENENDIPGFMALLAGDPAANQPEKPVLTIAGEN